MAGGPRLGVFGGTFDPVHNGHVVAAVSARHALGLDRVLVVPARQPWQKMDRELAPAEDRFAMLQAAVDGVDGLELSRLELDRPGPSYTADTLEELSKATPEPHLFLIVGADAAADLSTWDRPDDIRSLATIAVVSRAEPAAPGPPGPPGPGWQVEHVRIPALEISSTDLRRRVAAGEPLEGLMPPGAVRCLRERGLYAGLR
jgi:nicotinate-nucleotide adenylyltransferase